MKKMKWLFLSILSVLFSVLICTKISWEIDMKYWIPMFITFIVFGYISVNQFLDEFFKR